MLTVGAQLIEAFRPRRPIIGPPVPNSLSLLIYI